jgi:predicted dehydrogenase
MSAQDPVRLVLLGTGNMARLHAQEFALVPDAKIVAAVDVDEERARAFAEKHKIPNHFGSLEAVLRWGEFDAICNITPDGMHHDTTLLILAAGKHVFCEKPLATNYLDAHEMTEAAGAANVVAMVNLTYRKVPELQKARELVLSGAIGEVRHVEASYLQSWLSANSWGDWRTDPTWLWRLSRAHGSNGVLGDIGIHILDFASYGAALDIADMSCRLATFDKAPGNRVGNYQLDANDSFAMAVTFTNGALGVIHASRFATGHLNDIALRIFGDKGAIRVNYTLSSSSMEVCLGEDIHTQTWRPLEAEPAETNYQRFVRAVQTRETLEPSFAHAANLQRLLDLGLATERAGVPTAVSNTPGQEHRP